MVEKHHFIAVAGVMGSGKTTACRLLAERLGGTLMEENVADNAFLPLFYHDPRRWALAVQLFFLHERTAQLRAIPRLVRTAPVIQDNPVHHDYHIYTKAHHAGGNLTEAEVALYERSFEAAVTPLIQPDFIVLLDVSTSALLRRIRGRGRDYEKSVDPAYIKLLAHLQHEWAKKHAHVPILTVNTDKLNLASNTAHQDEFVKLVRAHMKKVPAQTQ